MAIDGLFLNHLHQELKDNLINTRINKIYQLSKYELLFNIRGKGKNLNLFISIHPNYARINLTEKKYHKPEVPPNFCMVLRKNLDGGIIKDIHQLEYDRVLVFEILHSNEIGDKKLNKLYIEIMGRHSNIILCNPDNLIIETIKHTRTDYRTLMPNVSYEVPHSEKEQPINIDNNLSFENLISKYQGLSKLAANEIVFTKSSDFIREKKPTIIRNSKDTFYFNDLTYINGDRVYFNTLSELLDEYYYEKDEKDRIKQKTLNLERYIKKELEKNKKKINNLNKDLEKSEKLDMFKLKADLIYQNMYNLKKGMKEVKVFDYEGNEVTISLDEKLSPSDNATKYYQKYTKVKKSVTFLNDQINKTKDEIVYFDTLLTLLNNASTKDALEIQEELENLGYLKKRQKKTNIRKNKKPLFDKYISPDNVEILVGKNNIQNDYITFKLANRFDLWMHAKDMPGSHVIIKSDNPSEETMRYAANLAAVFSKGRFSSSVPIDYTLVKNVKKIPGNKLGFVSLSEQKTIYIDPDESII